MRSFQSYLHGIEIEYELAAEVLKEKFQSYLHGIEIYHRQVKYDAADCSNRTFMELKSKDFRDEHAIQLFQSYLHGIEIC